MAMVSDSPHIASQVQAQEHVSASTDTNNTDDRDKVNDNNDDLNSTQEGLASVNNADVKQLKRSWLTLIPLEQVIEIVFRLEEHVSVEVREGIWPDDLKIAVDELRGKTVVNDEKASSPSLITESAVDTGNIVDSGTTAEEAKENDSSGEPVTEPITSTPKPAPVSQPTPSPSIPLPITSTLSHPPQPTPFTQPLLPTSTPPPHTAVAPLPPPPAHYPYYGYPGYAYAPMQNPHQQPYGGYSSYPAPPLHIPPVPPHPQPHTHGKQPPTPLFTSAPLRSAIDPPKPLVAPIQHSHTPLHHTSPPLPLPHSVPPHPIPPHPIPPKSEDDDLPSYEDMLVQALIEINDPAGVQPRTMFSWMASRYPLQTNFRPSASQALQKAYKRGRFEKSEDGRYRLNIAWEGGSTSKRTTRRPQTFAQSTTNPHPSSHPPAPFPYSPWTYGQTSPPTTGQSNAYTQQQQQPSQSTSQTIQQSTPRPQGEAQNAQTNTSATEATSQHSEAAANEAWEAAQSILQALNIGGLLQAAIGAAAGGAEGTGTGNIDGNSGAASSASDTQQTRKAQQQDATTTTSAPSAPAYPPPIIAGDFLFGRSTTPSAATIPSGSGVGPTNTSLVTSTPTTSQATHHLPLIQQPIIPPLQPLTLPQQMVQVPTMPAHSGPVQASRAALQGSLALLAAQLADIAGGAVVGGGMEGLVAPS